MLFVWYYNNSNYILLQPYREKISNDLIQNLLATPYSLLLRGDITKEMLMKTIAIMQKYDFMQKLFILQQITGIPFTSNERIYG